MPEPQEHWCNCQYYCHGVWTKLSSHATWFHHLQTTSAGPAGPLSTWDNDSDKEQPQKHAREADIEHYDEPPLADDDNIVDYAINAVHEPVYEPPDAPLHVPLDHDPQNKPENSQQDPL
ncbi:hypothetical protein DFH29DRAFT_879271 [Suillus ampliporus]|nr:hypothetical protein DFH29DRAFT_879271 [Suillus ampliporus]